MLRQSGGQAVGSQPIDTDLTIFAGITPTADIQALLAAANYAAALTALGSYTPVAYDAYAMGTAYSLTNTSAALTFGTTQPAITIATAGTYRISGRALLNLNGATFAANRTVTLKFRRINNTAANLTNGSTALLSGIVTTLTSTLGVIVIPEVRYTTALVTDQITIFGDVSVVPTLGSLDVVEASIHAERVA